MKYRNIDLAWAAGFLDGEGTININEIKGKGVRQYLGATQVRKEPLERLMGLFGGSIHYYEYSSSFWVWRLQSAKKLVEIIPLLIPHFSVKRAEAELLLEYLTDTNAAKRYGRAGVPVGVVELRREYVGRMKVLR
jgi:hypothetical protein